jgi:hypothetical protein
MAVCSMTTDSCGGGAGGLKLSGPIAQLVQSARLISVRSVVQIYLGPPTKQTTLNVESWECASGVLTDKIQPSTSRKTRTTPDGAVAQLGEHLLCKQGVVGSIPISSTKVAVAELK